MPEELPQPEQNPLDNPYSVESFAKQYEEKYGKKTEKDDLVKVSPEDIDFLTDAGFDWEGRKEVKTDVGIRIEMPRKDGQSAFVKPENFQVWISHLKDKEDLATAKRDLEGAFSEGEERVSEDFESMSKKELESLKNGFYDLVESVKRLYSGLYERDGQGLNPLIDSGNMGKLLGSAQNLEHVVGGIQVDSSYLGGSIRSITEAIEEIGNVSRRGGVNEDEESLLTISSLLGNVAERCLSVSRQLGGMRKSDADQLRESVRRLDESVESKKGFVARKIGAFREYQG